jgi:hypothetical protein
MIEQGGIIESQRAVNPRARTGRQILLGWMFRFFGAVLVLIALAYSGDYALLRYRIATRGNAYGSVMVHPYYAVPQKDRKTEFLFDEPRQEECVNSLFPHFADLPCWYLTRHKDRRIDM